MTSQNDKRLAELLIQAQKGNQNAYEIFLLEVSVELVPFIRRRVFQFEEIDDVLQETLMAIHRARHTYEFDRPVSPWLFAIARSRLIDFYRRKMRIADRETLSFDESIKSTDYADAGDSEEMGKKLHKALDRLPDTQRRIIKLLKFENMSVREVSEIMEMSEGAVKMTASRGYKSLRNFILRDRDED